MDDWNLIVVGDKKTPANYRLKKGFFMTTHMQEKYNKKLLGVTHALSFATRCFACKTGHGYRAKLRGGLILIFGLVHKFLSALNPRVQFYVSESTGIFYYICLIN